MQIKKYTFPQHGDARGMLVAAETPKDIPFPIKRIYYIYDTPADAHRGFHAHKNLKQIMICIHGSCKVLLDDGKEKEIVVLDQPHEGLYISTCLWREMYDFSPDAVLLVLASEVYSEDDYIRSYDEFLAFVKKEADCDEGSL